jgi:hypothetical protein
MTNDDYPPFSSEETAHVKGICTDIMLAIKGYGEKHGDDVSARSVIASFMFLLENSYLASGMTKQQVSLALQSILNNYSEDNISDEARGVDEEKESQSQ